MCFGVVLGVIHVLAEHAGVFPDCCFLFDVCCIGVGGGGSGRVSWVLLLFGCHHITRSKAKLTSLGRFRMNSRLPCSGCGGVCPWGLQALTAMWLLCGCVGSVPCSPWRARPTEPPC